MYARADRLSLHTGTVALSRMFSPVFFVTKTNSSGPSSTYERRSRSNIVVVQKDRLPCAVQIEYSVFFFSVCDEQKSVSGIDRISCFSFCFVMKIQKALCRKSVRFRCGGPVSENYERCWIMTPQRGCVLHQDTCVRAIKLQYTHILFHRSHVEEVFNC